MTQQGAQIRAKRSVEEFVRSLPAFLFVALGLVFIGWNHLHTSIIDYDEIARPFKVTVLILGIFFLICGIVLFFLKKRLNLNFALLLNILPVAYLALEFIAYLFVLGGMMPAREREIDGSFGLFNRPCSEFDSIAGYRWLQEDCRVAKVVKGEVIFDQRFSANNKGFISQRDYHFEKNDSTTKRWLIFGDSFTAAEFLNQPWPDRIQQIYDEQYADLNIEFYSFAVDGGGLYNWHRLFYHEILPYYEFDGLIFAIFGNDLQRKLALMHHTDSATYFQYFDSIPKNTKDFELNYMPDMWKSDVIFSDTEIDEMIAESKRKHLKKGPRWVRPDLQILMRAYDAYENRAYIKRKKQFEARYFENRNMLIDEYTHEDFLEANGENVYALFEEMMNTCEEKNIPVWLATIPGESGILHTKEGGYNMNQREVGYLARTFNATYFDGFEIYRDFDEEFIDSCFLDYDHHWSQTGSEIFAVQFAKAFYEWHVTSENE